MARQKSRMGLQPLGYTVHSIAEKGYHALGISKFLK